jgi:hypothetical protein
MKVLSRFGALCRRPDIIQGILSLIVAYTVFGIIFEQMVLEKRFRKSCESNATFSIKPKKQVLIAIMSAEKYLPTRAYDIAHTWGKQARDSKSVDITFIANNEQMDSINGISVTSLPGVDDTAYPPQRKSFSTLRYFHDVELDNYDWFMRVDDDVYVNIDKLTLFLAKLDPHVAHFIGQPGFGNSGDYMEDGMAFCMGGTGIIFSKETVRQLRPHLSDCLKYVDKWTTFDLSSACRICDSFFLYRFGSQGC